MQPERTATRSRRRWSARANPHTQGVDRRVARSVGSRGAGGVMGIYKRCEHRGRERDRCAHPWYGTYQLRRQRRVRVSLAKWSGEKVDSKGEAQRVFDDVKAAVRAGTFDPYGRGIVRSTD